MKKVAGLLAVVVLAFFVPAGARAQTAAYQQSGTGGHVELGAFADYFRLDPISGNYVGVGGRLGVNVMRHVQLEAEMNYDFARTFSEQFTNGTTVTTVTSNLRVLHGLFGPRFETGGPVKLFVTAKGGFINFSVDSGAATLGTVGSTISNLTTNNVKATFYPGGGIEGFLGPVGFRLDVGDEIFFANGAHNNLRVTFGPTIRF